MQVNISLLTSDSSQVKTEESCATSELRRAESLDFMPFMSTEQPSCEHVKNVKNVKNVI